MTVIKGVTVIMVMVVIVVMMVAVFVVRMGVRDDVAVFIDMRMAVRIAAAAD